MAAVAGRMVEVAVLVVVVLVGGVRGVELFLLRLMKKLPSNMNSSFSLKTVMFASC